MMTQKPQLASLLASCVTALSYASPNVEIPPLNEDTFLQSVRQLTYEGRRAGEGYFSPDGRAMVFQSEREPGNPFFQIYRLDLTTGAIRRISTGIGKTTCAFIQPNTGNVLFASTHLDADALAKQQAELEFRASGKERRYSWDYDPHMDIFVSANDELLRLTDAEGYDAEGAYSPDGEHIVFTSNRNAYPVTKLDNDGKRRLEMDPAYFADIYLMNADGSEQTQLTQANGYDGGPFFTADGERIIWRRFAEDGLTADIFTMRLDGTDVRQLTDFDSMSWAPYMHPSGAYAIFASNKLGFSNFELFIVDSLGEREPVRVTYTEGFDSLPVFAPVGQRLSWTSGRTSNQASQIFLADWDHANAVATLAQSPPRGSTKTKVQTNSTHAQDQERKPGTSSLRDDVAYLAADEQEGRMTGSAGAVRVADYIVARLHVLGLKPLGEASDFYQSFEFTAETKAQLERTGIEVIRDRGKGVVAAQTFETEQHMLPLSFSASGEFEGDVVFAGYGLAMPGELGKGYDSYAGLDVTDKIVLVLRYVPEGVDAERRRDLNRYAGLRYKAMIARERGAKAMLVVSGPNSPNAGRLIPLRFDNSLADSGILAASISHAAAAEMFAGVEQTLGAVQSGLDSENPHFNGHFPLNVKARVKTGIERVRKRDHNIVAVLPADAPNDNDEIVLVGAHYDHIGFGEVGSLADKDETGQIHNGADDNASGVAAILEIANQLRQQKGRKRGVAFAFWSGEELGLVGSTRFVDAPPISFERIVAYVNFDMVGRLRDNRLILQGIGSSSVWRGLIERFNVPAAFALTLQDDAYLPTDTTSFYPRKVPVLNFFTGSHDNYNRPSDDADTLNYVGLARIAKFGTAIVNAISRGERPDYLEVARSSSGGSRDTLRVYLGTIPDYTSEEGGMKLSGVRAGGPADKAGLQAGDIVVEFAGQGIANIYDYTYALDAVKIGEPVNVVIKRNGQRIALDVVPEARN